MPKALITGASGGIGFELAKNFAQDGYELILVAKEKSRLEEAAAELSKRFGVKARAIAEDLTRPGAPRAIFEAAGEVDVLVNNAGFGLFGAFTETDAAKEMNMLHLNVVVLTELSKLFLPAMVKKKSGKILNVASTAAFQPGPLMAVYYATKAYVLYLSEALAEELEGSGVTVTALCPGPTKTNFQSQAEMEGSKLIKSGLSSAEDVAREGYEALMSGQRVRVVGLRNRLLAFSIRFMPRKMTTAVVKKAQEREHASA